MKQQKLLFSTNIKGQVDRLLELSYKKKKSESKVKILSMLPESNKKQTIEERLLKLERTQQKGIKYKRQVCYRVIDLQSLQTTNRTITESYEHKRIYLFQSKLHSVYYRKFAKHFFTKLKQQIIAKYAHRMSKKRFQRNRIGQINPQKLSKMVILSFPFLNHRILSYKTIFMTKLELLHQQRPIKTYITTIIYLLVRIQERRGYILMKEVFQKLKNQR